MANETLKWKKAQAQALAALAEVRSVEADLRSKHAALTKERSAVENAMPPLDAVLANVDRLVDQAGDDWRKRFGASVVRDAGGHVEFMPGVPARERNIPPTLPKVGPLEGYLTLLDVAALAPDLVKANLKRTVRESGATFGLAPAERAAKLADLDAEIASIEQQHTELATEASLPLLPVVKERRAREAEAAKRGADLAAARARGVESFPVGGASVIAAPSV